MRLGLDFRIHFIAPLPLAGLSLIFCRMFVLVRLYAEVITHLCRLKIKVKIEGYEFER